MIVVLIVLALVGVNSVSREWQEKQVQEEGRWGQGISVNSRESQPDNLPFLEGDK